MFKHNSNKNNDNAHDDNHDSDDDDSNDIAVSRTGNHKASNLAKHSAANGADGRMD